MAAVDSVAAATEAVVASVEAPAAVDSGAAIGAVVVVAAEASDDQVSF